MSKLSILFVDSVAYKPYTCDTLKTESLGGTEASVLRVARGLAARGHSVGHLNLAHLPESGKVVEGINHLGADSADIIPDIVVHLRTAQNIPDFKEEYSNAKHVVWMHDLATDRLKDEPLGQADHIVCVSNFHLNNVMEAIGQHASVGRIYNPVERDGVGSGTKTPNRLGFFSSPHKGLSEVLTLFQKLRETRPELELVVANPGYFHNHKGPRELPGVIDTGDLTHFGSMVEMAKCSMLFYPQTQFPETFGLVLAEANALGVPVLAHDFGAAKEVLGEQDGNDIVDCTRFANVASSLDAMLAVRSHPKLDARFHIDTILDQWEALLK